MNPVDTKIRQRGGAYGIEPPVVLGYDVSGVVEAVGAGVEDLVEGDEVFYTPELNARGAYAEFHVAEAGIVVVKPHDLTHEEAAAIPLAACTAWQALVDRAGLELGETVLIHGGGGVGHFAVQIAHAAGARVVVVGNPEMEDALLDFGADLFVDYHEGDGVTAALDLSDGLGADVVFDTVGGDTLARSVGALAAYGRMVTIVGDATGDFGAAYRKNAAIYPMMMERSGGDARPDRRARRHRRPRAARRRRPPALRRGRGAPPDRGRRRPRQARPGAVGPCAVRLAARAAYSPAPVSRQRSRSRTRAARGANPSPNSTGYASST